jgi:hypothetical protein
MLPNFAQLDLVATHPDFQRLLKELNNEKTRVPGGDKANK